MIFTFFSMFIDTGMKTEYTEDTCSICNIILYPNISPRNPSTLIQV